MHRNIISLLLVMLVFSIAYGRDPLTDKNREGTEGIPKEGLGTLLENTPLDHPVQLAFKKALAEIVSHGGQVHIFDFGPYIFAEHMPMGPNQTIFRYNPKRLRAIDAMEEILHWEQIKEGGAYWRDYSNHPLYKKYKSKKLIMEDLAKKNLLQRRDLTFSIREELKGDVERVVADKYAKSAIGSGSVLSKAVCNDLLRALSQQ